MTKKEKILKACKSTSSVITADNFINYIRSGEVTFNELVEAGLSDELQESIKQKLVEEEEALWSSASEINTVESYVSYLSISQLKLHTVQAKDRIDRFDEIKWNEAQTLLTSSSLNDYLTCFPDGMHVNECNALLNDLPWLETKRQNTINAYNLYMQQHPGEHVAEAQAAILSIQDDNAWNSACVAATSSAYRDYLKRFPHGKHIEEAETFLNRGAAGELFLNALRDDPNAYPAVDPDPSNSETIQAKVANNVLSWPEIVEIFGKDKTEAIKKVKAPTPLPESTAPDQLQSGSTEVYFWGTPGSGKTCALGTIISTANREGIWEALDCSGGHYMDRLSNIFIGGKYCTLPDSTSTANIQEMIMNLTDKKGRPHKLTLIDLAGELFRMVYKEKKGLFVTDEEKTVLNKVLNYLKNDQNHKIHFFIVEYGADEKMWEDVRMAQYLNQMIQFLKQEKVFRKSTVGVYVLVTKCDRMSCSRSERPKEAYEYVNTELKSFWNTLERACKEAAIDDLRTLSFSVGDVFAQNLCVFNGEDTKKVIEKLLTKTPAKRRWDWLNN